MKGLARWSWWLWLLAAGCGGLAPTAAVPAEALPAAGPPPPPPPGLWAPASPAADGWFVSARVQAGVVLPEAALLGAAGAVEASLEMNAGLYSLGVGVGYYRMRDDDLGGWISVFPIRLGAKLWSDEAAYGAPRAYVALALGPYLCDHSRPDVTFDSTVGFDFAAGGEIYPLENLALGLEAGYTLNQPGVTISGVPYGANLDVFYLRLSAALLF